MFPLAERGGLCCARVAFIVRYNAEGGTRVEDMRTERRAYEQNNGGPQIRVHSFGCGSGILMTLLILGGILAIFFFLLPTFLIFAAIGAVVVFIMRLFM